MADLIKESLSQVESFLNTMKKVNELSVGFMNKMITDGLKSWPKQSCCTGNSGYEQSHRVPNDARIICPPQDNCPPRCLATITRYANAGEVIIVPFRVRNTSGKIKTYHLGVRAIIDQDGNTVAQPTLNKLVLEVQPGMSVLAEMKVVINDQFKPGSLYETDIVIRESRHNQNICFRLYINPEADIPEAAPYDESDIDTHFHRWYYHYYCQNERGNISPVRTDTE